MLAPSNGHTACPPGVYLCQVNETTACGACCGLYNLTDNSRRGLEILLRERTVRFTAVPRNIAALDAFADWSAVQAGPGPMEHFHHCPFLGLIGDNQSRVGCLLHPLAAGNKGADLRGLSYYGSFTCRTYFCPASRQLAGRYQQLLKTIFDHWYAYGLVATESRLVGFLLETVENRLGHRIEPQRIADLPEGCRALKQLLSIKIDWSYRKQPATARVHYLFKDGAHVRPPFVSTLEDGPANGLYSIVFQELVSRFDSPHQEYEARQRLDAAIDLCVAALSSIPENRTDQKACHATP